MIKQSLLVQRQIPQHIREEYPLFVKFIQAYYDYLYEQQLFDIESIHDIEEVANLAAQDSLYNAFIDKFKFELAKNFPIHMVEDKALVFKHLREFYLSRGSEESFKFLFRVLFNKSAEIFYPSSQMLRVSDGKWEQDTAIFIKPVVQTELGDISGSFVKITLSSGRVIDTYINRIVRYSSEIYEVFITREHTAEIEAGDTFEITNDLDDVVINSAIYNGTSVTVSYTPSNHVIVVGDVVTIVNSDHDGSYTVTSATATTFSFDYTSIDYNWTRGGTVRINKTTSVILPCPSKVSVFRGGSGFKIGDIFSLKTQKGNGCVVKVLKTATENGLTGVIKNIQVISFGLDYETTFYSYLSSSDVVSPEYVHPIKLGAGFPVPGDPSYTENSGGFADSGWMSRQEYFYYDDSIPSTIPANRYYADPSYTGTVLNQFYTDNTIAEDETIAIIKIELGGVAKYPGYYRNNDGFVSDIMYIQDGLYYQTFSYVIRVEEELSKYVNIIKALVHPVGMKVFSEYNIYNQVNLVTDVPSLNSSIFLPFFEQTPSTITLGDMGIGYTNYIITIDGENVITTPDYNSGQIFTNGSPSKIVTKFVPIDYITTTDAVSKSIDTMLPIDALGPDTITMQESEFILTPTILFLEDYNGLSDPGTELVEILVGKILASSISFTEALAIDKSILIPVAGSTIEDINMLDSGRIIMNSYDVGFNSYFDVYDDYQVTTQI